VCRSGVYESPTPCHPKCYGSKIPWAVAPQMRSKKVTKSKNSWRMRIRILRATGEEDISQLEPKINNWASVTWIRRRRLHPAPTEDASKVAMASLNGVLSAQGTYGACASHQCPRAFRASSSFTPANAGLPCTNRQRLALVDAVKMAFERR
jgi:hypothetical protein